MRNPEEEREPCPCVYFVFSQGLVKIGRTINLPNRIASLQRDDFPGGVNGFGPIERVLFVQTHSPERLESQLHSLMDTEHVTGEWFHLKDEDVSALESLFKGFVGAFQTHQEEELELQVYDLFEEQYDDIPVYTIVHSLYGEIDPRDPRLPDSYRLDYEKEIKRQG